MKKGKLLITMILLAFFIQGCGETETEKNPIVSSVKIEKELSVLDIMIENFDTSIYQENELRNLAETEIATYEETYGPGRVQVVNSLVTDGNINFQMRFQTGEDYERYTGKTMFVGTLEEAYKNGYSLDTVLKSAKNKTDISKDDLMKMADGKVIITSYTGDIIAPGKVLYYSENAVLVSGRTVTSTSDELTYIIYK